MRTHLSASLITLGMWAAAPLLAQGPTPRGPLLSLPGSRIVVTPVDGIDLFPAAIGLDPSNHVTYTMVNAGRSAVGQPFVAHIYVAGLRRDTYKHSAIAAQAQSEVVSQLARVDSCATVEVRVVADAQHVVAEASEANNVQQLSLTPKCSDLTVTAMKQDWQDLNTRYRIQITVQNQGNLSPTRMVIARAWGGPDGLLAGLDPTAWPILQDTQIDPLPPNGSTTFRLSGVYLGTDKVKVKVYLDFFHQIVEKHTDNNLGTKQFGPGKAPPMSLVLALRLAAILGLPADTVSADACALIPMDQLRFVLTAGLGRTFPIHESREGAGVSLAEPKLAGASCPVLKVGLTLLVHEDAADASTSGTVRVMLTLSTTASFIASPGKPAHTAPALVEAALCIRRVDVISLSLKNAPSWLTVQWLGPRLESALAPKVCFDVTSLVYVYLQRGGTLGKAPP